VGVLLDRASPRCYRELGTTAAHLLREHHCELPCASPETSAVVSVTKAELVCVACFCRYRHGGRLRLLLLLFGVTGNVLKTASGGLRSRGGSW